MIYTHLNGVHVQKPHARALNNKVNLGRQGKSGAPGRKVFPPPIFFFFLTGINRVAFALD